MPASIAIAGFLYLIFGIALRYRQLGPALYAIGWIARRLRRRSVGSTP